MSPLSLSGDDVIAQTASQCFDISVWQLLTAPVIGAQVRIIPNDITRDPDALAEHIMTHGVTLWEPVPSMIQAMLVSPQPLPHLRWVLPTGEALSAALVSRWFAQYPQIPLMNAYGPAECSDDVAFEKITEAVDTVCIGTPVTNAHLHDVDAYLSPVPIGVVGELAVSGPVVGRGYVNLPEQTNAVFKQNSRPQDALDQRLYLTGDLVKRLSDGRLEYVGRKDFQVKIRGFRIELGEIETQLEASPDIQEAVVIVYDNQRGDKQLVAYLSLIHI